MTSPNELTQWAREALSAEAQALEKAAARIGKGFTGAVDALLKSQGKVVVTGLGKSGHVARKIAATFSSTGTAALFLHPSEALHGDFGMMQKQDCLLAVAYGGETSEVLEVCRFARRIGMPVIAVTGKADSSLAQLAHHVIDGGVDREADPLNLAPTSSATVAMALGDALAVTLMRARGFTPQDFASLHPGGSLGRRLSLVKDHMHSVAQLPRAQLTSNFHEVLEAVTQLNFGIVAVIDQSGTLVGAVSDGDLRRALLKLGARALESTAKDLMSSPAKTIQDRALAIDAVSLMSGRSTSLFVVGGEPKAEWVGLIRLHDLLAAKIL